jgi:hypothetical protein
LEHLLFSIYWEFHHPNKLIFFRGEGIPPTSTCILILRIPLHQPYLPWIPPFEVRAKSGCRRWKRLWWRNWRPARLEMIELWLVGRQQAT